MSKQYKVAEAACYVIVAGVGSVLLYRDAPVPDAAENIDELAADGFIVEVESDEVGGHPSDLPPDYEHVVPGVVDGDGAAADSGDAADQAPAKSASRADWDEYAKKQGLTDEEVSAFSSKEDLQKHFGVE